MELDKVLAGAHKSQSNDGGVSSRILSYLLSWLANRNMADASDNRTFVIVTMNRTAGIPSEMLRPGRFDRIFSTLLPDQEARKSILRIHLEKRQVPVDNIDINGLAEATEGFAGGDLEEMVISARALAFSRATRAYEAGGPKPTQASIAPTTDDLLVVKAKIIPMSVLDKEDIDTITKFCENRTTPVGGSTAAPTPTRRRVSTRNTDASSN